MAAGPLTAYSLGSKPIKTGLQILFTAKPHQLFGDLALFEKQQRGNRAYPVLSGQFLVLVNIDLTNAYLAIVLFGELVEDRPERFARTAPFSPEIDQNRAG